MYAKPCCLSLVPAAHLCPLHHVPPLSGRRVLAVLMWPQHDWWLDSGTGSSPCQWGACLHTPVHHQPLSSRHSCQVSQNNDYLSPETNRPSWHLSQLESCSSLRVCSLPPRAHVKLHSFMFERHASMKVQEYSGACSLFILWFQWGSILVSFDPCPCTSWHPVPFDGFHFGENCFISFQHPCHVTLFSPQSSVFPLDYLSPETNLHPDTSPSWSFAPLKGSVPCLPGHMNETSFLRVHETC